MEENAVVVANSTTTEADIMALFKNIDVKELNDAIMDIANRTGNLTDSEKSFAIKVVDKWQTGIVQKLRNEKDRIKDFVSMVKNFYTCYASLINNPEYNEPLQKLVEIAGLEDKAQEIGKLKAEADRTVDELTILNKIGAEDDLTMTEIEKFDAAQDFKKEQLIKKNANVKAQRALNRAVAEFSNQLNGNQQVCDILAKLTSFSRKLSNSEAECASKANAATLAISIDDKDLRDKLNALIKIGLK